MPTLATVHDGDLLPERKHQPGNVDLFLYNAVLWNAHRIHYDHEYATQVERYPALVIDGPLQGDWMTQCVVEWLGDDGSIVEFEYSNRKAAYLGETLRTGGCVVRVDTDTSDVELDVFVRNEADEIISPGRAVVRLSRA